MDSGLYVTFFTEGDPVDRELPPVGPLERVVVRGQTLLADRASPGRTDQFGGGSRWLEAEVELQRATGQTPGGTQRSHLRLAARDGVYLRFTSYGEIAEPEPVPELGPYAVVVIGQRGVEADGQLVATRTGTTQVLWELTATPRKDLAGVVRPDIAVRTATTMYRSGMRTTQRRLAEPAAAAIAPQARASTAVTAAPAPTFGVPTRREPPPPAPRQPEPPPPPAPSADSGSASLLTRIGGEVRPRAELRATPSDAHEWNWAEAAWRLRYVIIGALVLLIAIFSVPTLRGIADPNAVNVVDANSTVSADRFSYSVTSARRLPSAGAARPRGVFVVVQVLVTNRGQHATQLSPSQFSLMASDGSRYAAMPEAGGVYVGDANPTSPFAWPPAYPPGQAIGTPVIFDIDPALTGLELATFDLPKTRFRLP